MLIDLAGFSAPAANWSRKGLFARFTPELEASFREMHRRELTERCSLAALVAAVSMSIYCLLDLILVPQPLLSDFLFIRVVFAILPLLGLWWLSKRNPSPAFLQILAGGVAISSGLATVALICLARHAGTPIAYEGIFLILFYYYCCGGLTMRVAASAGIIINVVYAVAEYHCGLPPHEIMIRALFLASTNVIGIISTAMMELSARRTFSLAVQLHNQASRDFMTGLSNRRALRVHLENIWEKARRDDGIVHLAMIDADFFKQYNDRYGHSRGDKVLRTIADVLEAQTRQPHDVAARFGGEEFVCVWSGRTESEMQLLLRNIEQNIRELDIEHSHSPTGRLTLSMGVVAVRPSQGTMIKDTLAEADRLLYRAKRDGRNRSAFGALHPAP